MATLLSSIETQARRHLIETTAFFWSSDELIALATAGIKDLWRDIVDLKQEHYLTIDNDHVFLTAGTSQLSGVPNDVHKVYLIEPRDLSTTGSNNGLVFSPLDYNHQAFQGARGREDITPSNDTIFYAIHQQGAPVSAPTILIAPSTTSDVLLSFCYVPTLGPLTKDSQVPIPGEADNAVVAWTVAFARAKEREDRSPDDAWLTIYATEKQHLLESLGLRQYQENVFAEALFSEYW